ncbi:hypothetical protein FGO68_gene14648 [Halteria grandinella]|uniref:Uncharacterized protein n=1 Tax=Halteria grandinella TaxID=5974 RepID=A0A8J8P1G7_HALGN|nr:hypothetical protein FGO68_gene14648 [Halteria grandinella]
MESDSVRSLVPNLSASACSFLQSSINTSRVSAYFSDETEVVFSLTKKSAILKGLFVFATLQEEKSFSFFPPYSARPFSCSSLDKNSLKALFSLFDSTDLSWRRDVSSITLAWLCSLSCSIQ